VDKEFYFSTERTFEAKTFTERTFEAENFTERTIEAENFTERTFEAENFTERTFEAENFTERTFEAENFTERTSEAEISKKISNPRSLPKVLPFSHQILTILCNRYSPTVVVFVAILCIASSIFFFRCRVIFHSTPTRIYILIKRTKRKINIFVMPDRAASAIVS